MGDPSGSTDGEEYGGERESAAERANRRICALFDASREAGTPEGARDAALISVLYGADVPRRRALRLARAAYDSGSGRLDTRRLVETRKGKAGAASAAAGDRGRPCPGRGEGAGRVWAVDGARRALDDWTAIRGEDPGPLFCPLTGGEPDPETELRPPAVDEVLRRWARRAGLRRLRTEAFRRLYRSPWWRSTGSG